MTDEHGRRTLQSVAAHLQGLGIGLTLGMVATLSVGESVAMYGVTAVAFVLISGGYIADKRRKA